MIQQTKLSRLTLLIGGIVVSIIGVAHIFMPTIGYDQHVPLNMPSEISDHFYYLGTYAICSFLLTIGFISLYVSRLDHPKISFVTNTLFAALWIARAILEIIYPVRLSIYWLHNPTAVLLPVMCFLALNYLVGSISPGLLKVK